MADKCAESHCDKDTEVRNLCRPHYMQRWHANTLEPRTASIKTAPTRTAGDDPQVKYIINLLENSTTEVRQKVIAHFTEA